MTRFACSEHLRSPQSDRQFHLPRDHTLLEGPAKAVSPEQLSLCLLRPKRLFHLFLAFMNKTFLSTGIHFSIHSCVHTPTRFHPCHVSLCACYLPASVQGSSCPGTPMLVRHGILCRKQEMMGKVNHSVLCITIYPALALCQTLVQLLSISFHILACSQLNSICGPSTIFSFTDSFFQFILTKILGGIFSYFNVIDQEWDRV